MSLLSPFSFLALSYFGYFSSLGLFLPYLPLFLKANSFTGVEISMILSLIPILKLITPPFWGYLADVVLPGKYLLFISTFFSALLFILLLFFHTHYILIAVLVFYAFFRAPFIPIINALTFSFLGNNRENFSHVRVWGSVGFIIIATTGGTIISKGNILILFPILMLVPLTITAVSSLTLPNDKIKRDKISTKKLISLLKNRTFIYFIIISMISRIADGPYYSFFSIHLKNLGFSEKYIGIAWSVGVLGEIALFIIGPKLIKKFNLKTILFAAYFGGIVRWSIIAFAKTSTIIIFSQLFHALTFGAFYIASVTFIEEITPPEFRATAQSIFASLSFNLGVLLGYSYSGFLYQHSGAKALFLSAALISLTATILLIFLRYPVKKDIQENLSELS